MVSNRLINRLVVRILISVTIFLIVFNEYVIYRINEKEWNNIECITENCTRLLLVADPQILGETSDKMLFSTIAMADSDRYLEKTFRHAVEFSKPNIVCFLGDLLDEGSVATDEQYKLYIERFQNIFNVGSTEIKQVHVPGDNDIGGENGEYISNSNLRRFEIEFESNDIFEYQMNNEINLNFFKINRMLLDYTTLNLNKYDNNDDIMIRMKSIRIGLSHLPLLLAGTQFLKNLLNDIDPNIIFTAHWHESRIFTYPIMQRRLSNELLDNRIISYDLYKLKKTKQYLEIMVPTSSYRMGKDKIGYGFAVIDNYILRYTVLWTYSRFTFLYLYLIWSLISVFIIIVLQITLKCSKRLFTKRFTNTYGKISLLPNTL